MPWKTDKCGRWAESADWEHWATPQPKNQKKEQEAAKKTKKGEGKNVLIGFDGQPGKLDSGSSSSAPSSSAAQMIVPQDLARVSCSRAMAKWHDESRYAAWHAPSACLSVETLYVAPLMGTLFNIPHWLVGVEPTWRAAGQPQIFP